MLHTLVAVFDNRGDAQKAMDDLIAGGFSRSGVRMSEGGTGAGGASAAGVDDDSIASSIKAFFSDLFGSDRSDRLHVYSEALERGHFVLSVTATSEAEVERAADLVERYGPLDIDEHASGWETGATAAGMSAGAMGLGARQESPSLSRQSQQDLGSMQGGAGSMQSARPGSQSGGDFGSPEASRSSRIYPHDDDTAGTGAEHAQRRAIDKMVDPADVPAFQEDAEDDKSYRTHWTRNYAGEGKEYDEYAPAYEYGKAMRRSELYRGRPWEDVEVDLSSDWGRLNPGAAWESIKSAVRHGWDRLTGHH
ncbi:hypothetical protein [Massilia cavernae]|uniref:Uncharacterized protein n=1 Tax=Massilia cavernae TaxID=2320864 RepID=A0A418Y8H8_9BURK|nr:hypothetical protein [Massilia cavernae]RJG27648.1 hypothetical protein D3872_00700 [Massilia cavernae]